MTTIEYAAAFCMGGLAYGAVETLWRGHTHWSMLLAGGVCYCLMYSVTARTKRWHSRCLLSAAGVTAVELVSGLLLNRVLGLGVWDYSGLRCNLFGQICLRYSLYWLALSLPCCALARLQQRFLFGRLGRS